MNLKCAELGLELSIPDKLLQDLYNIGIKHYPKEFGGVLVGRYSECMKVCYIEGTVLPQKYKSSQYYFERGKEGLYEELKKFYNQVPQLIYIGEWHTHPNAPPIPSETDKKAMIEISEHKEVLINSPVLIILGITADKLDIGAYLQFKNRLYRYE